MIAASRRCILTTLLGALVAPLLPRRAAAAPAWSAEDFTFAIPSHPNPLFDRETFPSVSYFMPALRGFWNESGSAYQFALDRPEDLRMIRVDYERAASGLIYGTSEEERGLLVAARTWPEAQVETIAALRALDQARAAKDAPP